MKFKEIAGHAIRRYGIRTGTSPLEAPTRLRNELSKAKQISLEEACKKFSITKIQKGDTYWTWYDDKIKEDLLAIKRKDDTIITVLTQNIYDTVKKGRQFKRIKVKKGQLTYDSSYIVEQDLHYKGGFKLYEY